MSVNEGLTNVVALVENIGEVPNIKLVVNGDVWEDVTYQETGEGLEVTWNSLDEETLPISAYAEDILIATFTLA